MTTMSDPEDFTGLERSKPSVTKASLSFLLDGIDPRDLAADGISIMSFPESCADSELGGGIRDMPTCQELAIEGERLTKQGDHKQAIPLLESALELGTDDLQLLSVLWSLLGNAHFYLGDYEKAALCHQHDLAICNELGDERNQAQAYCNLGIANRKTGYLQRAKLCYERYLDISEKIEDGRSRSKAHHNLGDLHLTLGRLKLQRDKKLDQSPEAREHLQKAQEYFTKHLEYVRETQNKSAEARTHGSLGYVYELLQDTDKAIDHYEQRLRIAVETSDKGMEGRSYCSIGNCLRAMIQPEKANECYARGLAIASELEDKLGEGVIHNNMGMTYEMLASLEQTQEHFEKELDVMKSENNIYGQALALNNLARTYEYMANLSKAAETLEALITVQKKLKQKTEAAESVTKLERVNELKETEKTKAGGTGGLKGTWKKLKGKKKKQRNLTAPEISSQAVSEAAKKSHALATVKEDDKDSDKGVGLFGGKRSKSKENFNVIHTPTTEINTSPKLQQQRRASMDPTIMSSQRLDSVSSSEDPVNNSEQRNGFQLSQADDHLAAGGGSAQPTPSHVKLSPPKSGEIVLTEQLSLSQTSGKISNLSLSQSFTGPEDQYSNYSQSSSDIPISTFDQSGDEGHFNRGFMPGDHLTNDNRVHDWPEGGPCDLDEESYRKGSLKLYWEFGDKQHKLNLQRVKEFLKSSGENEPVDLSVLLDWEGWMLASKDIPVTTKSKESHLI